MSTSSSIVKQQSRRQMHPNRHPSRNGNAYFDYDEYHRPSLINSNSYWNEEDYYYYYHYPPSHPKIDRSTTTTTTGKKIENRYQSKSVTLPPPRHRQRYSTTNQHEQMNHVNVPTPTQPTKVDSIKPSRSSSASSTNSPRKEIPTKNQLAATTVAMATRQQTQSNFNTVQTLMNSLMLQQQQQQQQISTPPAQLTNALVANLVQQRLKEAALQVQAALPTFLAAQALAYQQHLNANIVPATAPPPPPLNIAHPGTKFNNRPLVKFPVGRPSVPPALINPSIRPVQHRLIPMNPLSMTNLPTYQQVQEIERGLSLEDAIQLKNAIDIAETNKSETDKL